MADNDNRRQAGVLPSSLLAKRGAPTENRPAKFKQSITMDSRGDQLSLGVISWL